MNDRLPDEYADALATAAPELRKVVELLDSAYSDSERLALRSLAMCALRYSRPGHHRDNAREEFYRFLAAHEREFGLLSEPDTGTTK